MRTFFRLAAPLALAVAPLALSTPAHADIVDTCTYYHDIEISVHPYADICVNYPTLGPIGS